MMKQISVKIKTWGQETWKAVKACDNLPEWIAVLLIVGFAMFTMFYSDFQGTMDYAYQETRQIYHGNFSGLKYLAANSYGMTMFTILVIWMLPFYPLTLLIDANYWYYGGLLAAVWSKLFLVVVTVFLVKGVLKVAEAISISKDYRKWMPVFLLSSVLYFLPVAEIGQCDIIATTFMVWGLWFYIKDDRKWFLLMFAIAIPMKYLPLMIFVPLVLLHEKKPLKIIIEGICGVSLFAVNLLIRKAVWGSFLGEFNSQAISGLTASTNSAGNAAGAAEAAENAITYIESNAIQTFFGTRLANSSVFFVVFILICILAYAVHEKKSKGVWPVYLSALVYGVFFLLYDTNIYWIVMLAPFLALLVFYCYDQNRLLMLLETVFGWCALVIAMFDLAWVVGGESTFEFLFLRGNPSGQDAHTFIECELELAGILPLVNSCYVACLIGMLVLTCPAIADKYRKGREEKFDRWVIWCRLGLLIAWIMLLVYLILIR